MMMSVVPLLLWNVAVPLEWWQTPGWVEIYARDSGFFISFPSKPSKDVGEGWVAYQVIHIEDDILALLCAMWSEENSFGSGDIIWSEKVEKAFEKVFKDRGKLVKKERVVYKGQKALRYVIDDEQAKALVPGWSTALLEAYMLILRGRLVVVFAVYEMRSGVVQRFFDSFRPLEGATIGVALPPQGGLDKGHLNGV
jgi:hypothetical protein